MCHIIPGEIQFPGEMIFLGDEKIFKIKKEYGMKVLKVISAIYVIGMLLYFLWLDCKSKEVGESLCYKIFVLLQSGVLAYIIIN